MSILPSFLVKSVRNPPQLRLCPTVCLFRSFSSSFAHFSRKTLENVEKIEKSPTFTSLKVTKHASERRKQQYSIPVSQTPEHLKKELQQFYNWMTIKFYGQQEPRVREVTAKKTVDVVRGMLGWMHRYQNHPIDSLHLKSLVPTHEKEGVVPTFDYLQWLEHERQVTPQWETFVAGQLIQLAKHLYYKQSKTDPADGDKPYSDIPVIKELRKLSKDGKSRSKGSASAADEELKWLSWPDYLQVCKTLRQEKDELSPSNPLQLAWACQKSLIFNILACIPDRQRTIRELELGKTLLKSQDTWTINHTGNDYKTGKTYGIRPPLVIGSHLNQDMEEFLSKHRPVFKPTHNFVFSRKNGTPLTPQAMHKLFTSTTFRLTGKKMNPHLVRDSIVTHLRGTDASERELQALAIYMGHSTREQQTSYDRRTKSQKVGPAVDLLSRVNNSF